MSNWLFLMLLYAFFGWMKKKQRDKARDQIESQDDWESGGIVDFGEGIGVKKSSAQITHYYNEENLIGKQVVGVCNFPEKNIAEVKSQVLILGAIEEDGKVVLLNPTQKTKNGLKIA